MALSEREISWQKNNQGKIDSTSKLLEKLNWPQVIHSTAFSCGRDDIPFVAKILGYKIRRCSWTEDGVWRNKDGSLKAFVLYEREKDGEA